MRFGEDWLTVVGVVRDTPYREVGEAVGPWFYLPILQHYRPGATVVLRTDGDPRAVARPLAAAVAALDPNVAAFGLLAPGPPRDPRGCHCDVAHGMKEETTRHGRHARDH